MHLQAKVQGKREGQGLRSQGVLGLECLGLGLRSLGSRNNSECSLLLFVMSLSVVCSQKRLFSSFRLQLNCSSCLSETLRFGSALLKLCHRFGVNFAGLLALGFSLKQLEEGSYHAQTLYKPLIPLLT